MTWIQKVTPNVNVSGHSGGCLAYVDDGVNPPKRQPTAQVSWQYALDTKVAHPGEEPPTGVWVPVYYSINNGPWAGYGHVAWFYSDGQNTVIYDSEFGCDNRIGPYSGGADLFNYMGWQMSYLGWSEMVDGLRIVEYVADNNLKENGEIEMMLLKIVDTTGPHKGKWFISNGTHLRYIRTPRMLASYQNQYAKMNLKTDSIYSSELFGKKGEFDEKNVIW